MSYNIDIKNLQFSKEKFETCFFFTTVKYIWKFTLDNSSHNVTLFYCSMLGKRQIFLNNKEIFKSFKYTHNFEINFPIEVHNMTLIQKNDYYILKIDNISFNTLSNEKKLQKFNIIEQNYNEIKKEKQLRRRKNKILKNMANSFNKQLEKMHEVSLNDDEEDEKTIKQSLRLPDETLDLSENNDSDNDKKKNNNENIVIHKIETIDTNVQSGPIENNNNCDSMEEAKSSITGNDKNLKFEKSSKSSQNNYQIL